MDGWMYEDLRKCLNDGTGPGPGYEVGTIFDVM